MNLLMVHNYYQIPGGEDTVLENEMNLLKKHGQNVYVYSRNNGEMKQFSKWQKLCLPFTTLFSIKTYREIIKEVKEKEINLIHVHNTLCLISPSVFWAAKKCKVPVVQTIHNFRMQCPGATFYCQGEICEKCYNNLLASLKSKCYRDSKMQTLMLVMMLKLHRIIGTYRDVHFICLTEFNKKKLLQLNENKKIVDEDKVYVKPNFYYSKKEIIPYEKRKNQFIYVGRLEENKGLKTLLTTFEQLPEYHLLICGTGTLEDYCKSFIEEHNTRNIELKGFVEHNEAIALMVESKAVLLPTKWYEGFPMTIVESFSVGTPIIGSSLGNVGDLIEEGKNGYRVEFDNVVAVKHALDGVNTSISQFCLEEFQNKYNEEVAYNNLINIYRKIV